MSAHRQLLPRAEKLEHKTFKDWSDRRPSKFESRRGEGEYREREREGCFFFFLFFYLFFPVCGFSPFFFGMIDRQTENNIIAEMWRVIIAIQKLIIHIKQGEASFSFACLRLYAFQKSFPQGVWMTLIPMWRCRLPPVVPLSNTHARTFAHTYTLNDVLVAAGEFKGTDSSVFLFCNMCMGLHMCDMYVSG